MSRQEAKLVAKGKQLNVEYVPSENGRYLAWEFMEELRNSKDGERHAATLDRLFQRLADFGVIENRQKFKKVQGAFWEFKKFQCRVLGFFGGRSGRRRFWLTNACKKKQGKIRPEEIKRAERIRDAWLSG
ncbi:MAG: type II toxin-antitoxin system RelE/ParE family toxin [Candidatus Lernaella stagnicola]|nr:type II toxin-antitoxin system RelE/ParE family toxin [Candidatus Lernaella stagnicola]